MAMGWRSALMAGLGSDGDGMQVWQVAEGQAGQDLAIFWEALVKSFHLTKLLKSVFT